MSDESIVTLSEETKNMMRNYAMFAGFFTTFITYLFVLTMDPEKMTYDWYQTYMMLGIVGNLLGILFGTILAFLHKRDLVAIYFIIQSVLGLITFEYMSVDTTVLVCGVSLILGVMFLFSGNEQKWIVSILSIICGLDMFSLWMEDAVMFEMILGAAIAAITGYCSFVLVCEKWKLPLYNLLTADLEDESADGTPVHFKTTGSIMAYILIATSQIGYLLYYTNAGFGMEWALTLGSICGGCLVLISIMMLVAGRMKSTPFIFMAAAFTMIASATMENFLVYAVTFLFLGAVMLVRKDSRILTALMFLVMGFSSLFGSSLGIIDNLTVSAILNVIPAIIAVYLSFALTSDGKLPLI